MPTTHDLKKRWGGRVSHSLTCSCRPPPTRGRRWLAVADPSQPVWLRILVSNAYLDGAPPDRKDVDVYQAADPTPPPPGEKGRPKLCG